MTARQSIFTSFPSLAAQAVRENPRSAVAPRPRIMNFTMLPRCSKVLYPLFFTAPS